MMERQELLVDSREEYAYLPAEREDKTIETGRPNISLLTHARCNHLHKRMLSIKISIYAINTKLVLSTNMDK